MMSNIHSMIVITLCLLDIDVRAKISCISLDVYSGCLAMQSHPLTNGDHFFFL